MAKRTLDDILSAEDDTGLLADVKATVSANSSDESRRRQAFEEICLFVDSYGYEPGSKGRTDPSERMLSLALKGLRKDAAVVAALLPFDRHHLLERQTAEVDQLSSLDEIIASENPLLDTTADDIFTLRNESALFRARPDRVAERRPCKDFPMFKPLFEACLADLEAGHRRTSEFRNEQEINAGEFFILNGSLLFIAEVNEPHTRNGKRNARLRLIFANGTEGDNLLRSLTAELYKEGPAGRGLRVSRGNDGPLFTGRSDVEYRSVIGSGLESISPVEPEGQFTGEVYIVRSLSDHPLVLALSGSLYKIGFTKGPLYQRLASAKDDPTFLFAGAVPVKSYKAYNVNVSKMESLLHRFFGDAQLDIEVPDRFGKHYKPQEWFCVSLAIVDRAVRMLLDGSIVHYRFNRESAEIEPVSP